MKMLWESSKKVEEVASRPSNKKLVTAKKKKKKHEKQVWYGSPLDGEAWEVELANLRAATARISLFEDLKSLLGPRSRLRMDPQKNLHFIHDAGKHVDCAITIKNFSKLHVAFKFRTTSPHHCYMRPNGGILAPNESIIAIVSKYIEKFEPMTDQERKTKDKFQIISLPVEADAEYYPDLFEDDEKSVVVERILRVIYIDPKKAPLEQVMMLQRRLAEAEQFDAARKKALVLEHEEKQREREKEEEVVPQLKLAPGPVQEGQGQVLNEWKKHREAILAKQQAGGGKSL